MNRTRLGSSRMTNFFFQIKAYYFIYKIVKALFFFFFFFFFFLFFLSSDHLMASNLLRWNLTVNIKAPHTLPRARDEILERDKKTLSYVPFRSFEIVACESKPKLSLRFHFTLF